MLASAVASLALLQACARSRPIPFALPEADVRPIAAPLTLRRAAAVPVVGVPPAAMFCAGGDVMLGSNLDTAWARSAQAFTRSPTLLPDPDALLQPLAQLLGDADVVLFNVEGAIGTGRAPAKCRPGSTTCYAFRQDPEVAAALRRSALHAQVAGNVANNHAMDAGAAGFAAMVHHLLQAGVHVVGADTQPAVLPLPDGDSVAVLGFSAFSAGPDARDLDTVRRLVARARARVRRVVVSLHIGAEGFEAQRTPDTIEVFLGEDRGNPVAIAHAAVDAGATLVVGHGPHVLRAAEWRGDALIAYSLGNLLTYGPFSRVPPRDRGALLCAALAPEGRVAWAEIRSTRQVRPGLAFPDPEDRASILVDSLGRLDFPLTGATVELGVLRRSK